VRGRTQHSRRNVAVAKFKREMRQTRPILVVRMNVMLLKGLAALVPACMLFFGAAVLSVRAKTPYVFLQLFGAG
jgi:hypothetical protein